MSTSAIYVAAGIDHHDLPCFIALYFIDPCSNVFRTIVANFMHPVKYCMCSRGIIIIYIVIAKPWLPRTTV